MARSEGERVDLNSEVGMWKSGKRKKLGGKKAWMPGRHND
jgi:hypothetical protein